MLSRWIRQVAGRHLLRALNPLLYWCAYLWRRLLWRTVFIAVTGSLGKTTVKECLADVLSARHLTYRSLRTQNARSLLPVNILRVRPWHRFAVIEVGASVPGRVAAASRMIAPDIAVILNIARLHRSNLRTVEDVAREKMGLLAGLRSPGGVAVVNGDEPLLSELPLPKGCRTIRFGHAPGVDFLVREVSARWPARLRFLVEHPEGVQQVQTRLVGAHWAASLPAVMAAARECGLTPEDSARTLRETPPFFARLQPVRIPCGAIVLRDEYNGSHDSFEAALEVFEGADFPGRRILVASDFSDSPQKIRRRLRALGRRAATCANLAVFVGPDAHHARNGALHAGMPAADVHAFANPRPAAAFLENELRENDLVLLKGRSDLHLTRLIMAQVGEVKCWKTTCRERFLCDICWRLGLSARDKAKLEAQ